MKKILFTTLLFVMTMSAEIYGFEHDIQMPSNVVGESWVFNKNEIKDILIRYLESEEYKIRNKKSARITIKEGVFPDKIVTLWIRYDITEIK